MKLEFPNGFLWGTASAAYQVEGAVSEDGRGPSIWDVFSHTPGKIFHNDNADIACDQYHRLESDLDLLQELNIKAYRFSVAWSRIFPEGRGRIKRAGLDYYQRQVEGLLARGITPMATLYHWDLPQALQEQGGWLNRDTACYFADYAAEVFRVLGDRIPFWITLNEPWCAAFLGYQDGLHAPGIRDEAAGLTATHHMLLGHGLAVQALRAMDSGSARLGITLNLTSVVPASDQPADRVAARIVDGNQNRLFLDPLLRGQYPEDMLEHYRPVSDFSFVQAGDLATISTALEFLGVNYYERHVVQATSEKGWTLNQETGPRSAVNVGITPEGLNEILLRLINEYTSLPLYVTENGIALHDYVNPAGRITDTERISYFLAHFKAAHRAIEQGVDLRGYFVWTLMDNYEWIWGYSVRYGLVYVDFYSQKRIPKDSAYWYREVIRRNGFIEKH